MTYFGFDVHKRWTQAVAIDEHGVIIREGRVANEKQAYSQFLKDLPLPWKGVLEAGLSWAWSYDTWEKLGVSMTLCHPAKVKAIAEAKIKNDRIDARMLAQLLRAQMIPAVYVPSAEVRAQKMLCRERIALVRSSTRLKNRLHRLLTHYHVPLPDASDIFGKAGLSYLENLRLPEPGQQIFQLELGLLKSYAEKIQAVQRSVLSQPHPCRAYLESLPGVGPILASVIALEVDRPERFPTSRHFASYCGLVPSLYSSGSSIHLGSIGRHGNHWLKWAFVEAAWSAMRSSTTFRMHYQRLREHKRSTVAIVACARKLAEIAHAVMTQKRTYQERAAVYA